MIEKVILLHNIIPAQQINICEYLKSSHIQNQLRQNNLYNEIVFMIFPPIITNNNHLNFMMYASNTTHKYMRGWGTRHTILDVPRHSRDESGKGDMSYYLGVPSVAEMDQA